MATTEVPVTTNTEEFLPGFNAMVPVREPNAGRIIQLFSAKKQGAFRN